MALYYSKVNLSPVYYWASNEPPHEPDEKRRNAHLLTGKLAGTIFRLLIQSGAEKAKNSCNRI